MSLGYLEDASILSAQRCLRNPGYVICLFVSRDMPSLLID